MTGHLEGVETDAVLAIGVGISIMAMMRPSFSYNIPRRTNRPLRDFRGSVRYLSGEFAGGHCQSGLVARIQLTGLFEQRWIRVE